MMIEYQKELNRYYSKKSAMDKQLKTKLKNTQGLDKKKDIIELSKKQRQEDNIDDENLNLLREPYIRTSEYIKQLDDELKVTYEKRNEYELNMFYEIIPTTEGQLQELKKYDTKIEELKKLKTKYILKKNSKKEKSNDVINQTKLIISEGQHEYSESDDIEEKKRIYTETLDMKFSLFAVYKENISIIHVESLEKDAVNKYSTINIDYTPIKKNQKKINTEKVYETKQDELPPLEFKILE
jgi:hypothetical protein